MIATPCIDQARQIFTEFYERDSRKNLSLDRTSASQAVSWYSPIASTLGAKKYCC
jgi:hypothetical protein